MPGLLGIPILGLVLMLQMAVISRLNLLEGTADLVMLFVIAWALQERVRSAWQWAVIAGLMVTFVSATPLFAPFIGILLVTGVARLLRRQVWQTPILAMFVTTFIGTVIMQGMYFFVLTTSGTTLPLQESLTLTTLPSALLNLILALPVYTIITDLANWVYPEEMV